MSATKHHPLPWGLAIMAIAVGPMLILFGAFGEVTFTDAVMDEGSLRASLVNLQSTQPEAETHRIPGNAWAEDSLELPFLHSPSATAGTRLFKEALDAAAVRAGGLPLYDVCPPSQDGICAAHLTAPASFVARLQQAAAEGPAGYQQFLITETLRDHAAAPERDLYRSIKMEFDTPWGQGVRIIFLLPGLGVTVAGVLLFGAACALSLNNCQPQNTGRTSSQYRLRNQAAAGGRTVAPLSPCPVDSRHQGHYTEERTCRSSRSWRHELVEYRCGSAVGSANGSAAPCGAGIGWYYWERGLGLLKGAGQCNRPDLEHAVAQRVRENRQSGIVIAGCLLFLGLLGGAILCAYLAAESGDQVWFIGGIIVSGLLGFLLRGLFSNNNWKSSCGECSAHLMDQWDRMEDARRPAADNRQFAGSRYQIEAQLGRVDA